MKDRLGRTKTLIWILAGIIVIQNLTLSGYWIWSKWRRKGISVVEKGKMVAERLGCFACHGPGGTRGILNPGSEDEEVPSWDGGTVMMYVKDENEVREWILNGMPKRIESSEELKGEREKTLIKMPSFKGWLNKKDLDNLMEYFKAVSWFYKPQNKEALEGREIAKKYGCFGCHGPEGRGNLSNPGSFKGYIPGWNGEDFAELVKNEKELEEWIYDGNIKRFEESPAASFFIRRQVIKMPKYKGILTDREVKALKVYIRWLRTE